MRNTVRPSEGTREMLRSPLPSVSAVSDPRVKSPFSFPTIDLEDVTHPDPMKRHKKKETLRPFLPALVGPVPARGRPEAPGPERGAREQRRAGRAQRGTRAGARAAARGRAPEAARGRRGRGARRGGGAQCEGARGGVAGGAWDADTWQGKRTVWNGSERDLITVG